MTLYVLAIMVLVSCLSSFEQSEAHPHKQDQSLAECSDEHSFCGYLQLNSMGVSAQQTCRCRGNVICPLIWDPFDGRSIMHGNDQYKYCESAPLLKPCAKDEIVYSTYMEMSILTMDTLVNTNRLHCQCPGNHLFVRNNTKFYESQDGSSIISTTHKCAPVPQCEPGDTCMSITDTPHSSFVTRKCSCPMGRFCPSDIRLAAERIDLDRGAYFLMQCK